VKVTKEGNGTTNSFFNLAEALETLTKGVISGVPCKAAIKPLLEKMR
jgi:hypothetical protein